MTTFNPEPGARISLASVSYEVMPHPTLPGYAFGQEGRKAVIYQLRSNGKYYALKIFKPSFRKPELVAICETLTQLTLTGLEVCTRQCLSGSFAASLLRQFPDMEYAVLMPWMEGATWHDIILSNTPIGLDASKKLAKNTSRVLADLETRGYAHCDIAGGNVIVNTNTGDIQLIDVEDMFGPGMTLTAGFPLGTDGYQHHVGRASPHGQWCSEGDRFSAAVLLAEMLAWHDPQIRKASDKECYFANEELQDPHSPRYQLLLQTLARLSPKITDCLARAWTSATLAECPTLSEWAKLLEFPLVSEWLPIQAPPPPKPYQPEWTPIAISLPGGGFAPIQLPIPSSAPPPTPAFFLPYKLSPSCFELRWLAATAAVGYIIEMSSDERFLNPVQVYKGSDIGWNVPAPFSGMRYFRICAYNAHGASAWSQAIHTWD